MHACSHMCLPIPYLCVCNCRGLLSGHVMAQYFKQQGLGLPWYNNELLVRAKEVGDRLLPAFNTSTGIPYPRVSTLSQSSVFSQHFNQKPSVHQLSHMI